MSTAILLMLLLILTQFWLVGSGATPFPHVAACTAPEFGHPTGGQALRTLYLLNEKPDHHPCRGPANPHRSD